MSEIKIFQGNQIGGCVTVISAEVEGKTHRIMIDFGSSLPGSNTIKDFTYDWEGEQVDAVFFTHYHGDHVGRMLEIPEHIPLYMGAVARDVMINIHKTLVHTEDGERHRKQLELLRNEKRIHTFLWKDDEPCPPITDIPGFTIEPYGVDHSAYDAYMFLIEAADKEMPNGKKVILHTGDFRGHGRLGERMLPTIKDHVHRNGRKVNSLVIEGTMMSRLSEKVYTESDMLDDATEYMKEHKYVFLICSSTNLDSLATFNQAAQKAARPKCRHIYTYSKYYEEQLKTFSNRAGGFSYVYQFHNVHKLDLNHVFQKKTMPSGMTQKEIMEKYGFLAMIKPEDWCEKFIDPFVEDFKAGKMKQMPVIIYSMWEGYLNDKPNNRCKNDEWIRFLKKQEAKGIEVKHMHTSGHATAEMLANVINAVNPTDEILPMHTERPDMFYQLSISEDLKKKVSYRTV